MSTEGQGKENLWQF